MEFRLLFTILASFVLILPRASAGEAPVCGLSEGSPALHLQADGSAIQSQAGVESCKSAYQENHCDELKASLSPDDQSKVLDCTRPQSSLSDTAMAAFGCAKGGVSFIVDTAKAIASLPGAVVPVAKIIGSEITATGRFIADCESHEEIRRQLLAPLSLLRPSQEFETLVASIHCEAIPGLVANETNNFWNRYSEKLKLQQSFRALHPDQTVPIHIATSDQDNAFLRSQMLQEPDVFQTLWSSISQKFACYTITERAALVCEVAANLIPGAALTKAAKLAKIAEAVAALKGPLRSAGKLARGALTDAHFAGLVDINKKLQTSEQVLFIDNTASLARFEILPESSYTVVIVDHKLVLGKEIPGKTGELGGARSHVTLLRRLESVGVVKTGREGSGAIRFHRDGTIDISGYHYMRSDPAAAEEIAALVRSVVPDAKLRITGDRLRTLRPLADP